MLGKGGDLCSAAWSGKGMSPLERIQGAQFQHLSTQDTFESPFKTSVVTGSLLLYCGKNSPSNVL